MVQFFLFRLFHCMICKELIKSTILLILYIICNCPQTFGLNFEWVLLRRISIINTSWFNNHYLFRPMSTLYVPDSRSKLSNISRFALFIYYCIICWLGSSSMIYILWLLPSVWRRGRSTLTLFKIYQFFIPILLLKYHSSLLLQIAILLTKTTAAQNEGAFSYHRVRGLYFRAVVFAATVAVLVSMLHRYCLIIIVILSYLTILLKLKSWKINTQPSS